MTWTTQRLVKKSSGVLQLGMERVWTNELAWMRAGKQEAESLQTPCCVCGYVSRDSTNIKQTRSPKTSAEARWFHCGRCWQWDQRLWPGRFWSTIGGEEEMGYQRRSIFPSTSRRIYTPPGAWRFQTAPLNTLPDRRFLLFLRFTCLILSSSSRPF